MNHKTTKKHFDIFKKECAKWIEFFGLKGYEIDYSHRPEGDGLAFVRYCPVGAWAEIGLSPIWEHINPTARDIKNSAFHEVCELLLGRLVRIAESRYVTEDGIEEATHDIIRRIENSVFKEGV